MKLDITKDLLQKEIPSNKWLVKDTNKNIIRKKSVNVKDPLHLSNDEEMCIKKLIDFVRYSQDPSLNKIDTKEHIRPAVGLAAPQIGLNKNMFYARFEWDENDVEEYALINAKIISTSKQIAALDNGEGCLSVDIDHEGIVPRSFKIIVEGFDYLNREFVKLTLRNYTSIVFQHELDHNQGILYYDHINKNDPMFVDNDWLLI